jgi:hypothetical protein
VPGALSCGTGSTLLFGLLAVAGLQVDVGQRAVGGAEVDADGVTLRRSQFHLRRGEMLASCFSASCGRRTFEARQPRWLRVPLERRLADHVAGQAHAGGIEAFLQRDARAFGSRAPVRS